MTQRKSSPRSSDADTCPEELSPSTQLRLGRLDRAEELLDQMGGDRLGSLKSRPPPVILPPANVANSWRAMNTRKKISTVVLGVVLGLSAAAHLVIQLLAK